MISRCFHMPNKDTFKMKPIRILLEKYVKPGEVWVDPTAGYNSPATYRNDLNPNTPVEYHLEALEFLDIVPPSVDGVLFDPPYSPRQIKECYNSFGIKLTGEMTRSTFWSKIKDKMATLVRPGGTAICFGWNSMGIGINRGFRMKEILMISHGGHHNDTIVTVEKKRRFNHVKSSTSS